MTRYEKDTSASGLVIADYGISNIEYQHNIGFMLRFDRIRRIKIFTKDAYSFAEFDIPLYHNNNRIEKITSLKASTFNMEKGKIVETRMKNDGEFTEKIDDNWNRTKFTLPNVREGSVIDISYTVYSEFIFNFQSGSFNPRSLQNGVSTTQGYQNTLPIRK
ncbi:MAG: hypothetical protein WDN75_02705 [Bacteroidota bacterium]